MLFRCRLHFSCVQQCRLLIVHAALLTQLGMLHRPPVVAFKWRHWGEMTGPLRCPMGHGSTITAPATNANIEIWGVGELPLSASLLWHAQTLGMAKGQTCAIFAMCL